MSVAILVPVLKRPQRAAPLLANIESATPEPHRTIFIGTEDDLDELRAVRAAGGELLVLPGRRRDGDYARKINFAYEHTDEPFLFLAADDLVFHAGWLTIALAAVTPTFQVVGTNDLANKRTMAGHHSTHTLVTRAYCDRWGTIDEPGKVLHDGYNHWYVDDEFVQTAQHRSMFTAATDSHVEHLHYFVKKSAKDRTYRIGENRRDKDKARYASRCKMWGRSPGPKRGALTKVDPATGILTAIKFPT